MNKTTEALKLAEEALNEPEGAWLGQTGVPKKAQALAAIRAARQSELASESSAEQIPEWVDVDDYEEPVKQEPVAWIEPDGTPSKYNHSTGMKPLYTEPVDAKAIRAEALEEAAKVCEEEAKSWAKLNAQDEEGYGAIQCAAAIRGMK